MKVLAAKVNWYEGYGNNPRLQVLIDEFPPRGEMIFKRKKKRLYLAELDGYVRYFSWSGEGNDGGHYRRSFPIKVEEDGEVKDVTLLGPWSSRAGVMNQFFEQRCVDVSITDDPTAFERGHTFMAGAITLEKAMKAADMIPGVVLVRDPDDDEPIWIPARPNIEI